MVKNKIKDGKWLIDMHDASIDKFNIFKQYKEEKVTNAVIATALNTIKMPDNDY